MKRHALYVICLPLLLLSACQGGQESSQETLVSSQSSQESSQGSQTSSQSTLESSQESSQDTPASLKSYPMYSAISALIGEDGNINLGDQEKGELPLAFLPDQPYLPYVKPADYVRLFGSVESFITGEQDTGKTYTITFAREKKTFAFSFDSEAKSIIMAGDYQFIIYGKEEKDLSSNALEGHVTNKAIGNPDAPFALSYKETEIATFSYQGALYVPLALLDAALYKIVGIGTFFAYDRAYLYNEPGSLYKLKFIDKKGGAPYTLAQSMAAVIKDAPMPMCLKRLNRDIVTFIFDNYYGLKYALEIKSMAAYFKSTNYYDQMLSDDKEVRANALSLFVEGLNDGHTAVISSATAWGEKATKNIPQSIIDTRATIESALKASRTAVYNSLNLSTDEVRYSKDGSTAVFPLGKFAAYDGYYDKDTGKPTVTIEEATKQDTYLQSKAYFEEIDKKGGVKNVIIDMSTNDGGDSATMGNLLTLLSKDNTSTMYFQNILTGSINEVTTRLDINRDGKVDENDKTFGKYRIFLLVSPAAFSCGTAYPFYASAQGLAKIIGQKPAGGECVLGQAILPNGQILYHSSLLRVCYPKGDGFIYDEAGPDIDIEFDYNEFYDLEKMIERINEEE